VLCKACIGKNEKFKMLGIKGTVAFSIACIHSVCWCMNIVMTVTPNYIDYAMVAIHSMMKNTPAEPDNPHKVVIFCDETSSEDRECLLRLAGPMLQIYSVDLQDPMWNEIMQQLEKIKERGFRARHRIVSLRLLFPNIWQSGNLAALGIPEMADFLSLDADTLTMKNLKPFYDECLHVDQPIIGANLWFITDDNLDRAAPLFCGGVGEVSTNHLKKRPNGQISARTSGGVVFWNMNKILDIYRKRGCRDFLLRQSGEEEEIVFDSLLSRLGNRVYFFSYIFNARPDYHKSAHDLFAEYQQAEKDEEPERFFAKMLRNTKNRDCADMFTEQSMQSLKSLAEGDVVIWHWDGCKYKPADLKCPIEPGSPEEMWRQCHQKVLESSPSTL
jgi:lipopolysaccharide biosynthesis glycosyltransferase